MRSGILALPEGSAIRHCAAGDPICRFAGELVGSDEGLAVRSRRDPSEPTRGLESKKVGQAVGRAPGSTRCPLAKCPPKDLSDPQPFAPLLDVGTVQAVALHLHDPDDVVPLTVGHPPSFGEPLELSE